jgi:fibronectin type 3 domain-containing protein
MAHSASLSWTAPTTGDPATSYVISRATVQAGPFTTVGTSTTTTYVDSTVTAGTTYYYEVEAVNSAGESGPSNEVTAVIPVSLPAAPTGLAVVVA